MNYTKATNFATKDSLLTGDPQKLIKGTELNTEFDAIATAIGTKEDKLPTGIIVIWSGAVANVPTGWALCDGLNSTPDLRDRFVVGSGLNYNVGAKGGTVTATTSTLASATYTSSTVANHSHGGATAAHALTIAEMPAHTHSFTTNSGAFDDTKPAYVEVNDKQFSTSRETTSTGGSAGHAHGIAADGGHSHTTVVPQHDHTVDTRSPYYALAYIMKL